MFVFFNERLDLTANECTTVWKDYITVTNFIKKSWALVQRLAWYTKHFKCSAEHLYIYKPL